MKEEEQGEESDCGKFKSEREKSRKEKMTRKKNRTWGRKKENVVGDEVKKWRKKGLQWKWEGGVENQQRMCRASDNLGSPNVDRDLNFFKKPFTFPISPRELDPVENYRLLGN